jgi:uncharacterized protein (DUF58 family)
VTRTRLAFLLGAAVWLAAWAFGSTPLAIVGVGLALAAGLARAWRAFVAGMPVAVLRRMGRAEYLEGDDVWVTLELERGRRLVPTGSLAIRERIRGLGERETRLRRDGRRLHGDYVLEALPRGRYAVESVEIVVDDPLGLERVVLPARAPAALVVHPRLTDVEVLFSEAGPRLADGRRLLLRRPTGFDLHSVREYEQGESLRKVHWPTTARRGRLMVKDLEDAPRDELAVVLDCDARSVVGEPPDSSFEMQVRAAGSLLRAYARRGRRAALTLYGHVTETVHVASLEHDWEAALDTLAGTEASLPPPVATLLDRDGGALALAEELALVTARLEPRLVDRLVRRAAARQGVSVVWVDAGSWAGRPRWSNPALLRLQAAGVAVAVLRRGDDLRAALSAPEPTRTAAHG